MCARSQAEGAQAGAVRAAEGIDRTVAALAVALQCRARTRVDAEIEAVRAEAAMLALAAARRSRRAALAALPARRCRECLREAMHQAIGEPRITLRAAPDVIAALQGTAGDHRP